MASASDATRKRKACGRAATWWSLSIPRRIIAAAAARGTWKASWGIAPCACAFSIWSRRKYSRQAHEAVGKAVQLCVGLGCNLQDLALKDLKAIQPAFDSDLAARLELPEVLALHDVPGGTAPIRVKQAIHDARVRAGALSSQEQIAAR